MNPNMPCSWFGLPGILSVYCLGRSHLSLKIEIALCEQSMHHGSNDVPVFTTNIDFAIDNETSDLLT